MVHVLQPAQLWFMLRPVVKLRNVTGKRPHLYDSARDPDSAFSHAHAITLALHHS